MEDLSAVLTLVRVRIAKFHGQAIGEENTKHALIEPVLRALGWDLEDLDEVRCEYKLKQADNPVDYALFVNANLRLFVEAKALGGNLDNAASQIMGYAGVAGIVGWIVLTDGNEYRVYNAHAQVPFAQKLFKRLVIASGDSHSLADLSLLSKAQLQGTVIDDLWAQFFIDRQVKHAVEGLGGIDPPADFVKLVRKRTPTLSLAEIRQSVARAALSLSYPGGHSPTKGQAGVKAPAATSQPPAAAPAKGDKTPWRHVKLSHIVTSGLVALPLDIEATYRGSALKGRIEPDGSVTWNGAHFASLSMAGAAAKHSVTPSQGGKPPATDGWTFWRFRDADGQLLFVDVLRQRCAANAK